MKLNISIFWKGNPLHDGAVILDKYRLIAGGGYLPLADAPEISRWYGTRHRAALGITVVSGWKAKLKALDEFFWTTKRDTDQTGGLVK